MAFKFSEEYEEYKKKRKQEEYEQEQQQKKANFENLHNTKTSVMNQISNEIQKNSKINKTKIQEEKQQKNNNLWDDIVGIASNIGYGAKSGLTQIPKMLNIASENGKSGHIVKQAHKDMFIRNPNISEHLKQEVMFQDTKNAPVLGNKINNINSKIKPVISDKNIDEQLKKEREQYTNIDGKIETNLLKKGLQDSINSDSKKIQENADKMSNGVTEYVARNLAPSIGQMGVGAIASAIHPVLGATYFTTSSSGSYFDDAKQRGMNDKEAYKYGTIMGAVEGATEMIGVGSFQKAGKGIKTLIKGTGKNAIKEGTNQLTKSTLKSALKDYGIGIADNVMQEAIIEPIQELTAQTVGGKDKANWEKMGQRMLKSGIDGGLVSAIVGGSNLGISSCNAVVEKINNGQTITQQDVQTAVKDASKQLDVSKMVVDSTQQQLTKFKDYTTGEVLNQNTQDILNQAQNIIQNNKNTTQNQEKIQPQQIMQEQNKMAQNGNTEQIKPNIINDKVNEYINTIKDNFETKINIETKVLNNGDASYIDYNRLGQSAMSKKAESLVDKFKKRVFKNNNEDIHVSNGDIKKSISETLKNKEQRPYKKENLAVFSQLKQIIEDAKEISVADEQKERSYYKDYKYYVSNAYIDGKPFVVEFDTRMEKGTKGQDERHFRLERVYPLNNEEVVSNTVPKIDNTSSNETTSFVNNSIPLTQQKVNSDTITNNYAQNNENNTNNIEKNQEIMYNNPNEMESGINGNIEGYSNEVWNRLHKESKQQQNREFTWEEYNKWEQSIKPIEESKFTNKERQSINRAKKEYNKNIVLFDENENDNTYSAGASRSTKDKIMISRQQAEEFGFDKTIDHENVESDFMHNEVANDILSSVKDMILKDDNFGKQKKEFWKNQPGKIPTDELIAKDIICDRFSEIQQKEKLDYNNVLSNATKSTIDNALSNYYFQIYGKELEIPSSFFMPTAENTKKVDNLPTNKTVLEKNNTSEIKIPIAENTKGEDIDWNKVPRPEGKFRKHYKSIIESSQTTAEAKKIARELMDTDTYVPESNKRQLQNADSRIETNGADKELTTLSTNVDNGGKITSVDIAVGERLIEYYSKIGDKAKLQEAIQTTAMAGTQAGQTVQALALLNHQTPQGQVTWIQRTIDKVNKELKHKRGDNAPQFDFTPEMQQKILETTDKKQMNKVIDEVYNELGQQVPKSTIEKIDSWRYFSMLANPKTHIRNVIGNFAMGKMQGVKNKLAGAIEGTVAKVNKDMERTHTLKPASQEVKQFAKNDLQNTDIQTRLELNQDKYNPKSRIENAQRTFKSDALEKTIGKAFELNEKALEVEDAWGLKSAYVKSLSEYMTANKLTPDTITEQQLAKARNHAIAEAKEATFHSENAIASAINQFSRKNKATKYVTDAVLPFVKTPMNVAKAGIEYNPVGLIKTLTADTVKLRKGNITVNKYIDNLSKGLTGTGIAVLGYAMAEAGILKASGGDDDKKEKYDEALGKQSYAIEINGKTFSLDWLAPAGIPLFVGAEAHNIKKAGKEEKNSISTDDDKKSKQIIESLENWANAMSNSMSPMAEMSMISGLTSALKSYDQDSQKMLGTMATNSLKSYVNQFVPTALGQVARTTDEYERNTTSTKTGIISKAIDQTKLQVMSKVPGLRQKLPIKTDIWGEEQKQDGNIGQKAIRNAILPFTVKNVVNTEVDKELTDLYNKTGEASILPVSSIDKTFTIDGQNYRMTNDEYSKYKTDYGKNSHKLLNDLITSKDYKNLNDEQKQKAIENVYSYVKENNKIDYAKNNNLEVKASTLYETMEALKKDNGNQSSYLNYIARTTGVEKEREKNEILSNANYDKNTKSIIYQNTTGKDDKLYNILSEGNININEYLDYKIKESKGNFKADKDKNGKAESGSSKKKYYNYVNNNISGVGNKLLILGGKYKLQDNERKLLTNYINKTFSNKQDRLDVYKKFTNNYVVKNGKVYYK